MKHKLYAPKNILILSCAALALLTAGCARRLSPSHYSSASVGEAVHTYRGVIVSMRKVEVAPDKLSDNAGGMAAGGIAGGLLGSQIGSGDSAGIVGAVLGAAAGATAGMFVQDALMSQEALEYVVQLDNGQLMTIVQGPEQVYGVGQRVLVMVSNEGRSRVVPDMTPAHLTAPHHSQAQAPIEAPKVAYVRKKSSGF